jgi:hypothetical protein
VEGEAISTGAVELCFRLRDFEDTDNDGIEDTTFRVAMSDRINLVRESMDLVSLVEWSPVPKL